MAESGLPAAGVGTAGNDSSPFARVLFNPSPFHRDLQVVLARNLRARRGARFFAFPKGAGGVRHYSKVSAEDGIFETVEHAPEISLVALDPMTRPINEVFAEAQANEAKYGFSYHRFIMTDHHVGLGYFLAGTHHPRSAASSLPYAQVVEAVNRLIAFWADAFERHRFTLVLNPAMIHYSMARHFGVPCRTLVANGIDDLYFWYDDPHIGSCLLRSAFEAVSVPEPAALKPMAYHMANQQRFHALFGLRKATLSMIGLVRHRALGWVTGQVSPNAHFLRDQVRMRWRACLQWRQLLRIARGTLADLEGRPFVFYAVQEEPEISLSYQAPEATSQLGNIKQIARDLPAGVVLAVKEHIYGVGRRPADFYRQIAKIKNVVFLDPRIPGQAIVAQASACASVTSTALLEAAMIGKPVLTYALRNRINIVDHVHLIHQGEDLRPLLRELILGDRHDGEKACRDGGRLKAAMRAIAFPAGAYDPVAGVGADDTMVQNALDLLDRSLAAEPLLRGNDEDHPVTEMAS